MKKEIGISEQFAEPLLLCIAETGLSVEQIVEMIFRNDNGRKKHA